jgi:hypothetical protein
VDTWLKNKKKQKKYIDLNIIKWQSQEKFQELIFVLILALMV